MAQFSKRRNFGIGPRHLAKGAVIHSQTSGWKSRPRDLIAGQPLFKPGSLEGLAIIDAKILIHLADESQLGAIPASLQPTK